MVGGSLEIDSAPKWIAKTDCERRCRVPLPWVRLDSNIASNHKILALLAERDGYRAAFAYVCALGYCGGHGTDGFIVTNALGFVHGTQNVTRLLTKYGLWIPAEGGWLINDWEEYQESTPETQKRRVRAQAGAAARANGQKPVTAAERSRRYRERKRDATA
jgi:hypothetical protein